MEAVKFQGKVAYMQGFHGIVVLCTYQKRIHEFLHGMIIWHVAKCYGQIAIEEAGEHELTSLNNILYQ